MYVCVQTYVCMYVCMYVWITTSRYTLQMLGKPNFETNIKMYVCTYVYVRRLCMYVCLHVRRRGLPGCTYGRGPRLHTRNNERETQNIHTYIYIYMCVCVCPTHAHTLLLCPVYNPCISVCKQTQVQLLFNKSWFWGST
jgi:hypothetical protein